MINLVHFHISHLDNFKPKDEFEDLERDMTKNLLDTSKTMLTLQLGTGETLAIVGISTFRAGVGEVWILPSVYVDDHKLGFYKDIKSLIYDYLFNELKYHRLEIAILKGWEKGMKWAKSLGFKKSHICEAYDSHYRDHVIFTRIMKWQ